MTEEILERFESDSITFTVYGLQVEGKATGSKLSTRELKEKQGVSAQQENIAASAQRRQSIMDVGKQSMEIQMLQKRLELLTRKEARIQELCKQHSSDKKDANYQKFYDEVSRVATSGGAFKQKVKMLTSEGSKSTVDVSDTFSVYSFEFDSSKHKYQTGADQVGKNLDALGEDLMEEENIDEDLDAAVVIVQSEPKQPPNTKTPPAAAAASSSSTAPPVKPPTPSSTKSKSKACSIQ